MNGPSGHVLGMQDQRPRGARGGLGLGPVRRAQQVGDPLSGGPVAARTSRISNIPLA